MEQQRTCRVQALGHGLEVLVLYVTLSRAAVYGEGAVVGPGRAHRLQRPGNARRGLSSCLVGLDSRRL